MAAMITRFEMATQGCRSTDLDVSQRTSLDSRRSVLREIFFRGLPEDLGYF
jgi:hypothetical protein